MKSWLEKLDHTLIQGQLLDGVRRLLIAVSGGPDSTALLELLVLRSREAASPLSPELWVGHVHHGLRGAEADLDEAFVRALALEHGLPLLVHAGDARLEARRWKLSPEAAARRLRQEAFARWAHENGIDAIALAHHRDDQAETVLLRASRGAGFRGLASMPVVRPLGPGSQARLIRPFLSWTRQEIEQVLKDLDRSSCLDSSNADLTIPRNWVRRELLPGLEAHVHPGARRALVKLAEQASRLRLDLEALGRRALGEARRTSCSQTVSLEIEALRAWPQSVVWEAIRQALSGLAAAAEAAWDDRSSRQVLGWVFAHETKSEAHLSLRGGYWVDLRYGLLRLGAPLVVASGTVAPAPWPVPGFVVWGGWKLSAHLAAGDDDAERLEGSSTQFIEALDAEPVAAAGPLEVRSRRDGDSIHALGARGSKKLKELFRERRVPPDERDHVPVVVAGGRIVWVVGHRIADQFRLSPSTRSRLVLTAQRLV